MPESKTNVTSKESKQLKIAAGLVIIGVFANAFNRMSLHNVFKAFAYAVAIFLPVMALLRHYKQKIESLPKGLSYAGLGIGMVSWRILRPYPTTETTCAFMLGFLLVALSYMYADVNDAQPER
ncbi:hypothetical protein [Geomonas oryzae]|jgi:hypothetical protein|uniref:hypothetical protein n=1 Tax=Geomonas oryzae TaxID=2364273 RepID=UPI00100A3AE3|nr:hypothetical protein [Geomonas oryzae]